MFLTYVIAHHIDEFPINIFVSVCFKLTCACRCCFNKLFLSDLFTVIDSVFDTPRQ